ncbi:MAG: carbohydrate kinase [Caulobacter sp.]|nr:carbohydrate kinase [Caulobacter sp.]
MSGRAIAVLDVGKTNGKLTLWDESGGLLARRVRANVVVEGPGYRALDAQGIEDWAADTLAGFARQASIAAIVPVSHGAGAALIRRGRLIAPPMDYEDEAGAADREDYEAGRDLFAATGSPALPGGLNLGMQLHRLERMTGPWAEDVKIVTWAQYWAWRLCGVAATEATSLGCHTDLWRPADNRPSTLAVSRGWASRFAPLRRSEEALGPLSPEWVLRTGLPGDCVVHCGLHDSNAALLAARGHPEIAGGDATILSTGTWFVAMRSTGGATPDTSGLDEARDCLVNVDASGRPAPSARFMGGREAELMAGLDIFHLTDNYDPATLIERLPGLIRRGVFALPGFVKGVGPFPRGPGGWINAPDDALDRRAAAGLYLALMADASLSLIGSRERLLIEGRFAEAQVFIRALASLRPRQKVYVSNAHDDVPYGALRLLKPDLAPPSPLTPVAPLDIDLSLYARRWRVLAEESLVAA